MELHDQSRGIYGTAALVPAPPPRRHLVARADSKKKRPSKTSSERGRAYRERLKTLLDGLDDGVFELQQRIAELKAQRSLQYARSLQRRHHAGGSLVRLVHKYYTLFEESMAALPPMVMTSVIQHDHKALTQLQTQCDLQLRFLEHIMDPEVVAGELRGPLAILDQWRRYSSSHTAFRGKILEITASGDADNPVVTLRARASGKINGATFHTLFPGAMRTDSDTLVRKFLHRDVVYEITNRYMFTSDGRICCEIVDIGFVQGLLDIGATLEEVAWLMASSAITSHCTLQDRVEVVDA